MAEKNIRVRMKTLAQGPSGKMRPGHEYELGAGEAKELIEGGYAEVVKEHDIERATKEPQAEKAVTRSRAGKSRSGGKKP